MFKRALVSVSDKKNLIPFLKPLVENGMEIVSTGGSAKYLREQGWKVTDISEVTKFPEILDGRVKTLHPFVHMGLLAKLDNPEHLILSLRALSLSLYYLTGINYYNEFYDYSISKDISSVYDKKKELREFAVILLGKIH